MQSRSRVAAAPRIVDHRRRCHSILTVHRCVVLALLLSLVLCCCQLGCGDRLRAEEVVRQRVCCCFFVSPRHAFACPSHTQSTFVQSSTRLIASYRTEMHGERLATPHTATEHEANRAAAGRESRRDRLILSAAQQESITIQFKSADLTEEAVCYRLRFSSCSHVLS